MVFRAQNILRIGRFRLGQNRCLSSEEKTYPVISSNEFLAHSSDPTSTVHLNNQNRHRQLGPVYAESFGPDVFAIFISSPKICRQLLQKEGPYPQHAVPQSWLVYNRLYDVKRGLFFLDGHEWWKLRQKVNPIMMRNDAVASVLKWSEKVTVALLDALESELQSNNGALYEVNDMEHRLHCWSVESMLASLLGEMYFDIIGSDFDIHQLIKNVQNMFAASTRLQTISSDQAAETGHPDWVSFQSNADEALKSVNDLTRACLPHARSSGLVQAMKSSGLSDDEICRLTSDFIIAAADTTSYTTLWCLHLLSKNTEAQENCRKESINLESGIFDSSKLTYIRWCNKEAMRLFPVAPFITRILPEPAIIDGYKLPSNQLILLSTYTMSRDEQLFTKPLQFWPERWHRVTPTRLVGVSNDAAFASLPFGHGIRSCVGKRLAEHQVAAIVCKFVQRFHLHSLNENEIEMTMRLIGLPDKPIRIGISPANPPTKK